eukprot:TRINITY_DN4222_c0_g1_i1.p1 TRINITY_DN4222_c0_g1~~TRINITY_DN4222_c0_g1_i1.p1  ORF type:complete len:288 (-),score=66.51 TRINITY_DN4222_c0_g1_i1:572-1435(-)
MACFGFLRQEAPKVEQGLPVLMMSKLNGENAGNSDNVHKKTKHFVRTGADEIVKPAEALQALILGNERYRSGIPVSQYQHSSMGQALVEYGQSPFAAVIGCADSRCPVDTLFDAMPGDLFVCRNAGNTCTHAEGSMVGSLEFCVTALRARLIIVLGHTKCGAVAGATKMYLEKKEQGASNAVRQSALQGLLDDLGNVAEKAQKDLGKGASVDEITNHAVQVNVFNTIDFLLKFSKPIRDMVKSGEVEIQGAVYDLKSGRVDFLGRSPTEDELLASEETLPPSVLETR